MAALKVLLSVFALVIVITEAALRESAYVSNHLGRGFYFEDDYAEFMGTASDVNNSKLCCEGCHREYPDSQMFDWHRGFEWCRCYKTISGILPNTESEFGISYTAGVCENYPHKCLSSPNYPKDYPGNIDIRQTVSVPAGHSMSITFKDFDVEDDPDTSGCQEDYLQFFDGNGKSIGGKKCGGLEWHGGREFVNLPPPLAIPTSNGSVQFHSGRNRVGTSSGTRVKGARGFKFCYKAGLASEDTN